MIGLSYMVWTNGQQVSYDVTKDGVKVAVLTFPKTAYRLGETVLGVVEVNERTSRARVLKVRTFLDMKQVFFKNIFFYFEAFSNS